jgi:ketosteroid isomerase-like protein
MIAHGTMADTDADTRAALRRRDPDTMDTAAVEQLVRALYRALAAADAVALQRTLHPSFTAHFAAGMPAGGGRASGPAAAQKQWWAIGRQYAVRAEPVEFLPCKDGRLVVRGRYRGCRRSDERPVDAEFIHIWRATDGGLIELRQLTDTARW